MQQKQVVKFVIKKVNAIKATRTSNLVKKTNYTTNVGEI